jgi:hypothetical protein
MEKSDPIPWTCPCCTRSLRPVEKYGHLDDLSDIHWCDILYILTVVIVGQLCVRRPAIYICSSLMFQRLGLPKHLF